jgi:hypothetical protein
MALTIYKISEYTNWGAQGGATFITGGVPPATSKVDLSNYYTKTNLQTLGESLVHFGNLINAYHNNLLGLEGGDIGDDSSGESSGEEGEFYHLSEYDYMRLNFLNFIYSLTEDSNHLVSLINDQTSPGNEKYYGTNISGTKGWFALPAGGGVLAFQTAIFANPLNIDATTYKDWICTVTGDTTLNLNNAVDGDAGMIELLIEIDSSGGSADVTFGTMFTKRLGSTLLVCEDGYDNFISWRKVGSDIVYVINYVI